MKIVTFDWQARIDVAIHKVASDKWRIHVNETVNFNSQVSFVR